MSFKGVYIMKKGVNKLGIDIGSTTVKIAVMDENDQLLFSDYERHFANIRETLRDLIEKAYDITGDIKVAPMITGSGGLTLAKHLGIPFNQEVVAVATALTHYAPQTDVAIELGGEELSFSKTSDDVTKESFSLSSSSSSSSKSSASSSSEDVATETSKED
jgi:activator of 2-hydroxyglutaryl-CoA dehydratase